MREPPSSVAIGRDLLAPNSLHDALRGETDFLARYRREVVGAAVHAELWVPAEELDAFNAHIVGLIEVIARFPP